MGQKTSEVTPMAMVTAKRNGSVLEPSIVANNTWVS